MKLKQISFNVYLRIQ